MPRSRIALRRLASGSRLARLLFTFVFATVLSVACRPERSTLEQAALLASRGQEEEAIEKVQAHLAEHPSSIAERRLLVRLFGARGDLPAAQREIEELERHLPPGSAVVWVERGHVLELGHKYEEALLMYDKAAAVAPNDSLGPKTGGLRAARWGEPQLSAPRLEEALRRDPRDSEAWHALGLVRAHLGDYVGARTAYESGLVADPDALENRIGLATVALAEDRPEAALYQYEHILSRRPRFAAGHLGRAWALIQLGRLREAEKALEDGERLGADRRVVAAQRALLESRDKKREHLKNR